MQKFIELLIMLALLGFSNFASSWVISAEDTGFYRVTGVHQPDNTAYVVGNSFGLETRNFFIFDVSGLGNVTTAALRAYWVDLPPPPYDDGTYGGGYGSNQLYETWTLFDVDTVGTLARFFATPYLHGAVAPAMNLRTSLWSTRVRRQKRILPYLQSQTFLEKKSPPSEILAETFEHRFPVSI